MLNRAIQYSENVAVVGLLIVGSALLHLSAMREPAKNVA